MTGRRLLKRVLLVFGFATFAYLFLAVVDSNATPLHPDIRKLVSQPHDSIQFAPARAGWNGPETSRATSNAADPTAVDLSAEATNRATRAALLTAALPDPRAVVAIIAAIIMLRLLRSVHEKEARRAAVVTMPSASFPQEQKAA